MGNEELTKGIECLHCKWVYSTRCKGHKPNADCVNYEERKTTGRFEGGNKKDERR